MPYATNPLDGVSIYFEDDGGDGPPVVMYGGLVDTVEIARDASLARALDTGEFRLVFVDHRGHGRSDKPHDPDSYRMRLQVADAVAVLDTLEVDRAHFIGSSYGGRLGFGIGQYAPERARSLVIGGQHPYPIDTDGPLGRVIVEALGRARREGIQVLIEAFEGFGGSRYPEPTRRIYLEQDPVAMDCAFAAMVAEGAISTDLARWRIPCLIYIASGDVDFRDQARRAAEEIPTAEFISVEGADHLSLEHAEAELILPAVLRLLRSTASAISGG